MPFVLLLCLSACDLGKFSSDPAPAPSPIQNPVEPIAVGEEPQPEIDPNQCSIEELEDLEIQVKGVLATSTLPTEFAFGVEAEDGRKLVYKNGSVGLETVLESASTSKWITATIILQYLESLENQQSSNPLSLESKAKDVIGSQWPLSPEHVLSQMTLRDLMSFTSGMTKEDACLNSPFPNFEDCTLKMVENNSTSTYIPGTVYYYSGSHLQVAGLMVLKARDRARGLSSPSGVTVSTWQNVFADFKSKTGLFSSSAYDLPSLQNPRLAGGMHWSGQDYIDFLRAFHKNEILSVELKSQQLSDQVGSAEILASPANRGTGEDWHYGLGLWAECHAATFNCQNNIETFSSAGAYGAYPFLEVKHKFFGLLSQQGQLGSGFLGYLAYAAVRPLLIKWATKDCSN